MYTATRAANERVSAWQHVPPLRNLGRLLAVAQCRCGWGNFLVIIAEGRKFIAWEKEGWGVGFLIFVGGD